MKAAMLACLALLPQLAAAADKPLTVYIGTYTGAKSRGIHSASFDTATGKIGPVSLSAETKNPSFLAVHPKGRFIYAANEVDNFEGKAAGSVSAFKRDPGTGKLSLLNEQPSGGTGPCHISVDGSGRCLLVANYGSGSVALLPIRPDGGLEPPKSVIQHTGSSINRQRQDGPHAHFIVPDPASKFALACDLGLDKVLVYRMDVAKGELAANDPPFARVAPGAGPRHMAFHPNGHWAYVINELNSTVAAFDYEAAQGKLRLGQQVTTLPDSFAGNNSCAEIQIHPSGKFLYASNRGHDSITVFAVDPEKGRLNPLQHQKTQGRTPRHFAIDPSSQWLLAENQESDSIVVFRISDDGLLTSEGQTQAPSPVCLVFVQ